MVTLLNICPVIINLCISRGDTVPWTFTMKTGTPLAVVNITGFSFLLTVDPSDAPTGSANNLFQLTGTITDAPNGIVQFEMSAVQADQTPNTYHYDLQQTDGAGKIRSVVKGEFEFQQDTTK